MSKSPDTITQLILRIGERSTQLVAKHLQLLRLEVEEEVRLLTQRLGKQAQAVGIAAPVTIAGLTLVSLGIALFVALLLRPLVGDWAFPLSLLVLGVVQTAVSVRWLLSTLKRLEAQTAQNQPQLSSGNSAAISAAPLAKTSKDAKPPHPQGTEAPPFRQSQKKQTTAGSAAEDRGFEEIGSHTDAQSSPNRPEGERSFREGREDGTEADSRRSSSSPDSISSDSTSSGPSSSHSTFSQLQGLREPTPSSADSRSAQDFALKGVMAKQH